MIETTATAVRPEPVDPPIEKVVLDLTPEDAQNLLDFVGKTGNVGQAYGDNLAGSITNVYFALRRIGMKCSPGFGSRLDIKNTLP